MASDLFPGQTTVDGPATNGAVVTPSDSTDLGFTTRAIYIGTGGNLQVQMANGPVLFTNLQAGQVLPIRASRIYNALTTAANIVALW